MTAQSWYNLKLDDRFNGKPYLDFTKPEEVKAHEEYMKRKQKEIERVKKGYKA
jgi:hypothetical protein